MLQLSKHVVYQCVKNLQESRLWWLFSDNSPTATVATRLFDKGRDEQLIMLKTSH